MKKYDQYLSKLEYHIPDEVFEKILEQVESKKKEIALNTAKIQELVGKYKTEIESLKAQLKREMAAVDFYADQNTYYINGATDKVIHVIDKDCESLTRRGKYVKIAGKLARETVKARTE